MILSLGRVRDAPWPTIPGNHNRKQIEFDIVQAGAQAAGAPQAPGPSFVNLKEWFAMYGEPKPAASNGWMTNFEESPKIYGGTNHHRGTDYL